MNTRPILHVASKEPPTGLASTTWEQRRHMSAQELIVLMGPLHVAHRDYKSRPYTLLPMPNLAGVQPCISVYEYGMLAQFRRLLWWAMR